MMSAGQAGYARDNEASVERVGISQRSQRLVKSLYELNARLSHVHQALAGPRPQGITKEAQVSAPSNPHLSHVVDELESLIDKAQCELSNICSELGM